MILVNLLAVNMVSAYPIKILFAAPVTMVTLEGTATCRWILASRSHVHVEIVSQLRILLLVFAHTRTQALSAKVKLTHVNQIPA